MNNQSETKNCQNCKKDFVIEPEDFGFYEKIKVQGLIYGGKVITVVIAF